MAIPQGNWTTYQKFETSDYEILLGKPPLECAVPLPDCTLEITVVTPTNVTIRGDKDGSIAVVVTGATGTTNWYLDGVLKFTGGSSRTFTGLAAGVYDIMVTDANNCVSGQEDIVIIDGDFRTGNFIVSSPEGLTAVENPIQIGVGTAINNPNPVSNITELKVVDDVSNGFYLKFNLTSPYVYTQTFYAKAYPNKPNFFLASVLNNQYGIPVGVNTSTEIATSLAEALQNDILIPKIYYINNNGTTVTLEAKETGSKFNLSTENVIASTSAISVVQKQIGTDYCDGQITDNYSISCEVLVNTNNTNQYPDTGVAADFNRVAEMILPFNQSNNHRFNIASILKSQVSTPKPEMALTGSTLLPSVMQPYKCRLSELYPLVPNTNTIKKRYKRETGVQWVINSSLDRYAPNDMNDYLGEKIHNVKADFRLTFGGSQNNYSITISNYLIDALSTKTTNIMFNVIENNRPEEGWQSSPNFTGIGSTPHPQGMFYVSGITSGITFMYTASWRKNLYNENYTTLDNDDFGNVKFLTNSPSPKQIQRNSNEFLYFILPKNYGKSLKVMGDLYFYDGSSVTGQTFFTIATGSTNAGGAMVMNLSYDKLGLVNYEVSGSTNRKIKRAEVAVYQSDDINGNYQYTEEKIYRFEIDEMPRKFGILFQNALGMYDSFDMIGVVEETVSRETGSYTVPIDYNVDGSISAGQKNIATYNTKILKKVTCNTGWIDNNHFDWLQELLKSNNVYSTNTVNQNYLNLTGFKYNKSSLDDLFDCEFTFDYTIYENNVSV